MKTTIAEARKLLKELKKKYPDKDCSVSIIFSSWSIEHLTAYISDSNLSSIRHYDNAEEIRKYFKL